MKRKLKILTVDRKNNDGYWIAGVFNTDEEIARYIELYLFDDDNFEVEEFDYPQEIKCLLNGEYVYQVLVINPQTFIIEHILDPQNYKEVYFDDYPTLPLRIILSAKNAVDVHLKCSKIMAERLVV